MSALTIWGRHWNGFDASAAPHARPHSESSTIRHHTTAPPTQLQLTVGLTVDDAVELAFSAPGRDPPLLTTFINPHSWHVAKHHRNYGASLAEFSFIFPDGIGVILGLWLLTGISTDRISFDSTSLALPVLRRASREKRSVMLIGGGPNVAAQAGRRLADAVDGLRIVGAMSGYCDYAEYEAAVRAADPDIVICGMGAPRQEELLVRLSRARAWKGLGYTCGGYFDQLQERLDYYPSIVNKLNLRWLFRMTQERRLLRRYAIEYHEYFLALFDETWLGRRAVAEELHSQ